MRKSVKNESQSAALLAVTDPAPVPVAVKSGGATAVDVVVLIAMAAAAVALGFALHLQANYGMVTASAYAAGAFMVASIVHAQRMRIHSLQSSVRTEMAGVDEPPKSSGPTLEPYEPSLARQSQGQARNNPDRAASHAAGQLSLAAAALRDADTGSLHEISVRGRGLDPARAGQLVPEFEPLADHSQADRSSDPDHGWAEPGTVDALVRQYAEELDRNSANGESARAPARAAREPSPRLPVPSAPVTAPAETSIAAAVRKAAEGEIEIHLQPVVAFSDRKARLYEVFPKIADTKGGVLSPTEYEQTATAIGLALAIERAAILRCCAIQRALSERGRARAMIVRLSQTAVRDRAFLQRLLTDMHADPLLTDLMVFEVDQIVIEQGDGVERENMDLLARAGFRFALGSAETLALELEELTVRRIGFVRISAHQLAADGNRAAVSDLRRGAIETIVTGITHEDQAKLCIDFGLVLGQGALFSVAKPLRADVVKAGARTRAA